MQQIHRNPVPATMRAWSVPRPNYTPVDITPAELRGAGLAASVAAGWAEPYATPDDVPDWSTRQATALVPYSLDEQGRPRNPAGRTGLAGRNLGRWGENAAADPIVFAGPTHQRRVLLIRRADTGEWAIPGGMVEPGETAPQTLARELREETGLDLAAATPTILARTYVADWRATDHAWVCSTVALYEVAAPREATAGDDATAAHWWPMRDLDQLARALCVTGYQLYPAHQPLLAAALEHADQASDQ